MSIAALRCRRCIFWVATTGGSGFRHLASLSQVPPFSEDVQPIPWCERHLEVLILEGRRQDMATLRLFKCSSLGMPLETAGCCKGELPIILLAWGEHAQQVGWVDLCGRSRSCALLAKAPQRWQSPLGVDDATFSCGLEVGTALTGGFQFEPNVIGMKYSDLR
eukprot:3346336-Amphidinium_carterae.2